MHACRRSHSWAHPQTWVKVVSVAAGVVWWDCFMILSFQIWSSLCRDITSRVPHRKREELEALLPPSSP
jgi:hypothetical protein